MEEKDRQSLRDLMATEVMGWHTEPSISSIPCYYDNEHDFMEMVSKWTPDIDSNQLDMLIDKMVEDGFNYEINGWADGFGNEVVFHRPNGAIGRISNFKDRRLAVLLAIKTAKECQ